MYIINIKKLKVYKCKQKRGGNLERNKLKSMRVLKGIMLKDMASELEITPQYLSKIESGKVDIKVKMLLKMADILDVEASELLFTKKL